MARLEWFRLGKPVLVLLVVALASGAAILFSPTPPRRDLSFWIFADSHRDSYQKLEPSFERATGRSVDIQLLPVVSMNTRLSALLMSGQADGELPDAVELEMGTAGPYLRPPVNEVGFLPLNHYLENTGFREIPDAAAPGKEGWNARSRADGRVYTFRDSRWTHNPARTRPDAWIDRVVQSRFAPWTKHGVIFGVPHDIHPVTITYRDDLFRQAGIDLSQARTWRDFHKKCLAFQAYWRNHKDAEHPNGYQTRHAMELFESLPDHLAAILLQRHVNLIDEHGQLHLTDSVVAETVAFYSQMVAGPRKVAVESNAGTGPYVNDLIAGNICATFTPDWRAFYLRKFGGTALEGKLRMMPLPRFETPGPDGRPQIDMACAPTTTWSGTMIGIPRANPRPDEAWRMVEFFYLSDEGLEARVKDAGILPPLKDFWDHPLLHQPDPLFGGQRTWELYIELADQIPAKRVNWASDLATQALGYVLNEANGYLRAGRPVEGLRPFVEGRLQLADWYVRRAIRRGTWEEPAGAAGAGATR